MSLLVWLVMGFIVGFLAKALMPGRDGGGVITTIILGIVGAVVGGLIGRLVGYPMISSFNDIAGSLPSFFSSVVGAIVVLVLYRLLSGRSIMAH
ncbi:MAG: GlsB/YeaQ/YmgE family stress response membrane protein [Acidobacteria bacterium]|nr:GlsB/YeaQ/YmgE family stress response membrane protein [Acidobacteriota bacterium]